jgi:autophagy-related protein 33
LVVVESETDVNGESVQRDMNSERKLQCIRAWFSGAALAMGIVGLWGDGA